MPQDHIITLQASEEKPSHYIDCSNTRRGTPRLSLNLSVHKESSCCNKRPPSPECGALDGNITEDLYKDGLCVSPEFKWNRLHTLDLSKTGDKEGC